MGVVDYLSIVFLPVSAKARGHPKVTHLDLPVICESLTISQSQHEQIHQNRKTFSKSGHLQ